MSHQRAHCSKCNLDRSDDATLNSTQRDPCPRCGQTATATTCTSQPSPRSSPNFESELTPGDQDRSWKLLRWRNIQDSLVSLLEPRAGQTSSKNIESAERELLAFFVTGYHLEDALTEGRVIARKELRAAMRADPDLALLRYLSILDEHHAIESDPWSGHTPVVGKRSGVSPDQGWRLKLVIEHAGRKLDGLAFAADALTRASGVCH